ncbi:MAG: hypothetical protein A2091_06965 [Desulfuromonadales bacterium GWD2_61_12]|nr:MAG: hypothetical protein A2091_06965 [Desulfuromonadales bacterium GWD2_61_12]OGR33320.1 MAG: hypothetical protein A2005_01715 [Desulfuromonadales bacterium GWC2_61_20]
MTLSKVDERCFVCGMANPAGLHVSFTIDKETQAASAHLSLKDEYQGWSGIVHGGILSTLLDEVCMHAARTIGDQMVTAEITVRYKKPVPVGSEIFLQGRVVGLHKRLVLAEGTIELSGTLMAEAEAKIFCLNKSWSSKNSTAD